MADPAVETAASETSDHLYLTLADDDENHVLELVRVSGEDYFIRKGATWLKIDADADDAPVWDHQIIDVTAEIVPAFDEAQVADPKYVPRDQFEDFELPDEDAA